MKTSPWQRHVLWLSALAIVLATCGDTGGEETAKQARPHRRNAPSRTR